MDFLQTDTIKMLSLVIKILFLAIGVVVVVINYFHTKEAEKMERKLSIYLPGSVHVAMSAQLLLSGIFVFAATISLFLFQ